MTPIKTFRFSLRLPIKYLLAADSHLLPDGGATVKFQKIYKTRVKIFLRQNLTFWTP